MGNKTEKKAETGEALTPFPVSVPRGDPGCLPLSHLPPGAARGDKPADCLCDGRLTLQHWPTGLMVWRRDVGCLGRHTHTPQESLASQGLGNRVVVRGLGRMYPEPQLARAYLQEAGFLSRWGCRSWNVQLQPRRLLALQAARAVPAGLAHGSRCSKAGLGVWCVFQ